MFGQRPVGRHEVIDNLEDVVAGERGIGPHAVLVACSVESEGRADVTEGAPRRQKDCEVLTGPVQGDLIVPGRGVECGEVAAARGQPRDGLGGGRDRVG